MTNFAEALVGIGDALAALSAAALVDDGLRVRDDRELLAVLGAAGRVRRLAEALMIEAVANVRERDEVRPHADRVTTRYGCRNMGELVQRATRLSSRSASGLAAAARAVHRSMAMATGEVLPAEFPRLREALAAGGVGADGIVAIASAFRQAAVGRADLLAADEELAAAASGTGADAAGPATADELGALAQVWAAYLDPDGAEPNEARAMRRRGLTIGRRDADGLVPVRGGLLPELAAQLQLAFDSVLNPRLGETAGAGPRFVETRDDGDGDAGADEGAGADSDDPVEYAADDRTAAQRRHDALAAVLAAAVASGGLPTLGGAAPMLVVQVRAEDLRSGRGHAHLPGADAPISIAAARQIACAGAVQRAVLGENGRIVSLVTLDRVFNHHQRRAITLRDGGCVIPGCHVPPQWCEIHHVKEHAQGGATHTDNGVLLCWFHHRTIDTGGWRVGMVDGVPHVKGPPWWDPQSRWRPSTKSPTRRRDLIAMRV